MSVPDDTPPATVRSLLAEARALGVDRLDAQLLLAHRLQRPRSWLLAHDDAPQSAADALALQAQLRQRADGVPLAYLTGERGFHGLVLQVTAEVLDPRPDTETLVDWALELLQGELAAVAVPQVADLGTGSGAIALAVQQGCPRAAVRATDASPAALAVARANATRLGLPVQFALGSWWQALGAPAVHLALSNPPYIEPGDPHLAALRHEPAMALVPAAGDGLADLRTLIDGGPAHLCADGWLLLEHGHDQGEAVAAALRARGYIDIATRRDLAGHGRCTGGRWPGR